MKFKSCLYIILFLGSYHIQTNAQDLEDLSSMIGYATNSSAEYQTTNGGEGGTRDTVYTLNGLLAYAKGREKNYAPAILYISGKISTGTTETAVFKHGANISILGIDNAELENVGLRIWDYHNTIVRNLIIHEVLYPDDALSIDESHQIWIDHCELYSINDSNTDTDTYDGLLDIKKGSQNVTVSWCKFHDHIKCMLIGHTDNSNQAAEDRQMNITIHHNYFYNTDGRNPSLRHGHVHLYNNYFQNITDYGMAVRQAGHALIENNHYEDVRIPIITNKFNGPDGFVCETGNTYSGAYEASANVITQTDCDFWDDLSYAYTLNNVSEMKDQVLQKAGTFDQTTSTTSLNHSIQNFTIAPNPVDDYINISLAINKSESLQISIIDLNGKSHFFKKMYANNNNELKLTTSHLPKGLYILQVRSEEFISWQKFVKL